MPRVAPEVPSEQDLLCESCGYILNGLSDDARCPECGTPVEESSTNSPRLHAAGHAPFRRFFPVTAEILFRPTRFYRALETRGAVAPARYYAWVFYIVTILLTQLAIAQHVAWTTGTSQLTALNNWFFNNFDATAQLRIILSIFSLMAVLPLVLFAAMEGVTRLAAWLTAWEAAYRGLRMPYNAVLRAIYFHAVHYLPPILLIAATVCGYRIGLRRNWIHPYTAELYLYTLSGEVILAAIYLFWTYWIAMRNIMYANR